MSNAIQGLEPSGLWKYFAEISAIPRGSKNEAAVGRYVMNTAERLGLAVKRDKAGNIVVLKPATPGREDAPSICLQGHLDMVCEKNADKEHDFNKDPITLVREGNVLRADGTTLGADNGVAVAGNLALMEANDCEHGPLEFLFTVDEETGLTGANALEKNFVTSRTLLNLDSEEEGAFYVGCAGGRDTTGRWTVAFEPQPSGAAAAKIVVKGLRGGHSGLDINKGRGNAIKILARAVLLLTTKLGARVARLQGGNKRNAIPREAEALVFLPKAKIEAAGEALAELDAIVKTELGSADPDVCVSLSAEKGKKAKVLKKVQVNKILHAICGLQNGVLRMSPDIAELVQTSSNVAVLETSRKDVILATSQRSSVASELQNACREVSSVMTLAGATVDSSDGYPGWRPDLDSAILHTAKQTYQRLYHKEPEVKAVHAGLECGIIGEKYPGMDMLSLGPTLEAVHSPEEKIYIDSVERFWPVLLGILKQHN